jgi:hypothetical protein
MGRAALATFCLVTRWHVWYGENSQAQAYDSDHCMCQDSAAGTVVTVDGTEFSADIIIGTYNKELMPGKKLKRDILRSCRRHSLECPPFHRGNFRETAAHRRILVCSEFALAACIVADSRSYRLLVPVEDLISARHEIVKSGSIEPVVVVVVEPGRKIVAYPCSNGQLLNVASFVCKQMAVFTDAVRRSLMLFATKWIPS